MWCFILSLVFVLETAERGIVCEAAVATEYGFSKGPAAILNTSVYRLTDENWPSVSSTLMCARQAAMFCPKIRGYIYQAESGLCTPMVWLHEGLSGPSPAVQYGEIYLTTKHLCQLPFKAVEYGEDRRVACVYKIPWMTFHFAWVECSYIGGYLVSVKTREKLAMVAEIANGQSLWVGLDDRDVEGVYVWQEDGSSLTPGVREAVFHSGEPNDGQGMEDCISLRGSTGDLTDVYCYDEIAGLCETPVLQSQC